MSISPHLLVGIALFLVQFALISYTFPLVEFFSALPITTVDHGFHQYQVFLALDLAKQGQLYGYATHFSAGYIGGITLNASAHLPAFGAWVLDGVLQPIVTYKLYVFISALIASICLPLAAHLLKLDALATWCAAVLGLALWWVSAFHWYHTVGMVSYVLISYLSIPYCAALLRTLQLKHQWGKIILLGLLGAIAFFGHPLFPIAVSIFVVLLHIFFYKEYPLKQTFIPIVIIATLALLPNLIWLIPMLNAPVFAGPTYQAIVDPMILFGELTGQWRAPAMGAKLYPALAMLSIFAAWRERDRSKQVVMIFMGMWVTLVLLSAFGAISTAIATLLQPNRFSTMGYLFLVIPASIGLAGLLRLAVTSWPSWLPQIGIVVLLPLFVLTGKEFVDEVSKKPVGRYGKAPPDVNGFGESNKALLQWISENTNQDGRILFETSLSRVHDGSHIAGMLAYLSKREFIGGPYPYMFFSGYWDGHVFGKKIQTIAEDTFRQYLDTYNVGWVIAHSPQSISYLNHQPTLNYVTQIGPSRIYQANRKLSFLISGKGEVSSQGYSLVVRTQRSDQPIILSYHYTQALHAEDGSAVSPVYIADDPQPFIKLTPKQSMVILCNTRPCRPD